SLGFNETTTSKNGAETLTNVIGIPASIRHALYSSTWATSALAGGVTIPAATTFSFSDNDPSDINLSNASVAENQPAGTLVGNFSSTDPDFGDTFTYSLVDSPNPLESADNDSFILDPSGALKTSTSFDFETKSSYSIFVETADSAGHTLDKAFTITITNAN